MPATFEKAEATWESLIAGYQPSVLAEFDLLIDVELANIDGPGNRIGSARPTSVITDGGFALATGGSIIFDIEDFGPQEAGESFESTVLHEMAHVMGFASL